MKSPAVIICALLIGVLALLLYAYQRPPEDVEVMSDQPMTLHWLTLAIAILSLLTAVVGLIQKIIELRHSTRG